MAIPHPELLPTLETRIADAVVRELRGDAVLAGVLEVEPYETEDLLQEASIAATPHLGVILDGSDEAPSGSNRQARLSTVITLALVSKSTEFRQTDGWLRFRLFGRIKTILEAAQPLTDGGGARVAEDILSWRRINIPRRLPGSQALHLTPVQVVYASTFHRDTRELV